MASVKAPKEPPMTGQRGTDEEEDSTGAAFWTGAIVLDCRGDVVGAGELGIKDTAVLGAGVAGA